MRIFQADGHLYDEALLLLDEGDLSRNIYQCVEDHLAVCSTCRGRQQELHDSERSLLRSASKHPLPDRDAARTRLQSSLLAASQNSRAGWWRKWKATMFRPAMLLRIGAVAALLVLAVTYRQAGRPLQDLMAAYEETGPEPNHALTPGSASALSVEEVCRLSDDDLDPKLPPEKQQAVFRAYRMDERAAKAYQVDYLINPQLGGDDSLQNLWPEPYHATVWNATTKDALETRLHGMVCNGQIDLRSAQQELATDWIAAYKKYFHASRPIRTVAILGEPSIR